MEIKNHQNDFSLPNNFQSYLDSLLLNVNSSSISDTIYKTSKNFLVVISDNGCFQKVSASFSKALGYSDAELLPFVSPQIVVE